MLALLFEIDGVCCAIPCARILEVLPWMPLHAVPGRAGEVRGVLIYRGSMIGVADARMLIMGTLSRPRLSTRIVIFGDEERRGGIICEGTQGVHTLAPLPALGSAPALGPMFAEVMQAGSRLFHVLALDPVLDLMCNPRQGPHGAQTPA